MVDEYNLVTAFYRIEEELIDSMVRNLKRHRAQEDEEGLNWSMWQVEQLKALEKYSRANRKKYGGQFRELNRQIEALIRQAKDAGGMEQEMQILRAIKNGFQGIRRGGDALSGEFFRLNEHKLEALIEATTHDMGKAETAVLRMADDQYRKIIFNAQVYANTGAGTYEKAVDMAARDFLAAGLNCVEYKNGARHTLPDYADMAIRTASKRAYLAGEGEVRKGYGISTVIMNKRGNPCPKCLPFCGKVLIDDVWSGGSRRDGNYPLMSTAIAYGLYHPRCKDVHTTYFPGISTADDTWTKEELEAIQRKGKLEAEQQYARRQEEKYSRLAKHSLDEENQKSYKKRAERWDSIENSPKPDIMDLESTKEVPGVHLIGKIDREIYKHVTDDIVTNEVIITDRQIRHIKERHPNDFERYQLYLRDIIETPDYIIEAAKPKTAVVLKEVVVDEKEVFKMVIRLATSKDNSSYKNSIITFMKIDEKEWNRLLRNKKVLYKRE